MNLDTVSKQQVQTVLDHLKTHGSISSLEAIDKYTITRLAACICELRKKYSITTKKEKAANGSIYARYYLDPCNASAIEEESKTPEELTDEFLEEAFGGSANG